MFQGRCECQQVGNQNFNFLSEAVCEHPKIDLISELFPALFLPTTKFNLVSFTDPVSLEALKFLILILSISTIESPNNPNSWVLIKPLVRIFCVVFLYRKNVIPCIPAVDMDICKYIFLDEKMYQSIRTEGIAKSRSLFYETTRSNPDMFKLPKELSQIMDEDDYKRFIFDCYSYQHSPKYQYVPDVGKIPAVSMADCCEWPHCGAKDGLDKDHLIPNSVVEKIGLVTVSNVTRSKRNFAID